MSDAKNDQPNTDSVNANSASVTRIGVTSPYLANEMKNPDVSVIPSIVFSFRLFVYTHKVKAVARIHVIMSDSIGSRSVILVPLSIHNSNNCTLRAHEPILKTRLVHKVSGRQ